MKNKSVFDTGGDGPVIVMIHGWGQAGRAFDPLIHLLKPDFRIITFDLAGHGTAKDKPGPFTFARYCDDIARLVCKLGLEKFHLLGWSMGGTIAVKYCLEKTGPLPESLMLLSATPRFVARTRNLGVGQHPAAVAKMERMIDSDPETGLRGFIQLFFESGEEIDENQRGEIEKALMPAGSPPSRQALLDTLKEYSATDLTGSSGSPRSSGSPGSYDGRILTIHGSQDKICPPGGQKLWGDVFVVVETVSIESAGHAPHLTRRLEVAGHIARFVSEAE